MKKYLLLPLALSMFSLLSVAQPKDGLYKKVSITYIGTNEVKQGERDSYLWINDGKAYFVKGIRSTGIADDDLYMVLVNATNIKKVSELGTDAVSISFNNGSLSQKVEKYSKDESLTSNEMRHFIELMKQCRKSKKKKQQLKDTWFECIMGNVHLCKYYGRYARIQVTIFSPSSMMFNLESVKYLNDGNTIEGNNLCKINWTDKYEYELQYSLSGRPRSQEWKRIPAPKAVTNIF